MGAGITSDDLVDIQDSFSKSRFIRKLLSLPTDICNYITDMFFYGPGRGRVSLINVNKDVKSALISTYLGEFRIPVMKMICFDIDAGFIKGPIIFREGLMDLENFRNNNNNVETIGLENIETYWILNYSRPVDVFGTDTVYFYVINEFDNLIYVREIKDNHFIDYNTIFTSYEKSIDLLDSGELDLPELESNYCDDCVIVSNQPSVCIPGENCCDENECKKDL